MNELIGALSRNRPDYMDADSIHERFSVIKHIFNFLLHHRVMDRKGSGESNPRTQLDFIRELWIFSFDKC